MGENIKLAEAIAVLDSAVQQMLREDLPRQRAAVHSALAKDDVPTAIHDAHAVHGAAAFCRLDELRVAAMNLELALKDNNRNAELIRAFDNGVDAVLHALERVSEPSSMGQRRTT